MDMKHIALTEPFISLYLFGEGWSGGGCGGGGAKIRYIWILLDCVAFKYLTQYLFLASGISYDGSTNLQLIFIPVKTNASINVTLSYSF